MLGCWSCLERGIVVGGGVIAEEAAVDLVDSHTQISNTLSVEGNRVFRYGQEHRLPSHAAGYLDGVLVGVGDDVGQA